MIFHEDCYLNVTKNGVRLFATLQCYPNPTIISCLLKVSRVMKYRNGMEQRPRILVLFLQDGPLFAFFALEVC
jgi:hypothetical protein